MLAESNILILDNAKEIQLLVQYFFRNQSHHLVTATNINAVNAILEKSNIDLVIIDIDDNTDDRFGFITNLRKKFSSLELPIIIITDLLRGRDVAEGLNSGANDYIRKPFSESEFLARINTHLTLSRKNAELNQSKMHFKRIVDNLPEIIYRVDFVKKYETIFLNQAIEEMTGFTITEIQNDPGIIVDLNTGSWRAYLQKLLKLNNSSFISKWLVKHDRVIWVENTPGFIRDKSGKITGIEGVVRDITRLKAYDVLTELPNKELLLDTIEQSFKYKNQHSWLILFDIRNFSLINQSLGYSYTEKLLQWITNILKEKMYDNNTLIARIDESRFGIFISHNEIHNFSPINFTINILDLISNPFTWKSQTAHLSINAGIAEVKPEMQNSRGVLLSAESALTESMKKVSRAPVIYHPDLIVSAKNLLKLESNILLAVKLKQFILFGQPIINIQTGRIEKVEILLRWRHPTQGLIAPDYFIPYLENSGLILEVGEWVIDTACKFLNSLENTAFNTFVIAINVSAIQLNDGDIAKKVKSIIQKNNINASQIELEITESIVFGDSGGQNLLNLESLREIGVKLALDDFGTGYSSLSYLKYFPVNTLKIDRSFILNIETHSKSLLILKSIINMALDLELNIVAEGIEELTQLEILRDLGCQYIQGYLISKPMPCEELQSFIADFHNDGNPELNIMPAHSLPEKS